MSDVEREDERRAIIERLLGKRTWTSDELREMLTVAEVARRLTVGREQADRSIMASGGEVRPVGLQGAAPDPKGQLGSGQPWSSVEPSEAEKHPDKMPLHTPASGGPSCLVRDALHEIKRRADESAFAAMHTEGDPTIANSEAAAWAEASVIADAALTAPCLGPPDAPSEAGSDRPKIVCLCGSTRFKDAFDEANYRETMAGRIVLSVGFFMHATGNRHGEGVGATPEQKVELDTLHLRKIDLADEVLVLNVGGYIGESTRREIAYAIAQKKPVRYLEPLEAERGAPPPDTT